MKFAVLALIGYTACSEILIPQVQVDKEALRHAVDKFGMAS
jgi:hypothetical protein